MKTQLLELMFLIEPDEFLTDEVYCAVFCGGEEYYVQVIVRPDKGSVWEANHLRRGPGGIVGCTHGTELASAGFTDKEDALSFFWGFFADPEAGLMTCRL